MNIIDRIESAAAQYPDRAACLHRGRVLRYRELIERSDALASFLIEQYPGRSPVIVHGHKEPDMIPCFLACVKSGRPYIPVEYDAPFQRIEDIIGNSGAGTVISVCREPLRRDGVIGTDRLCDIYSKYRGLAPDPRLRVAADDTFYILYTSGSTGSPKGVRITRANIESFLRCLMGLDSLLPSMHPFRGDDIYMNQVSYAFDVSVMSLYPALMTGCTLHSFDRPMASNLRELFDEFRSSRISVWVSTPSFAELCLSDRRFNGELLPGLRMMLFCGEVLSNGTVERLFERFGDAAVVNTYGPTEATVAVTAIHVDREMNRRFVPLPVGYPMENCTVLILDDGGSPVPAGGKGEVYLAGEMVSPGYQNNPVKTAEVFSKRTVGGKEVPCYRTGDLGYMKDGMLFYAGRADFQIKLHGHRIEIEDIENNMRKIDIIGNAVVIPSLKEGQVTHLNAFVTLQGAGDLSPLKRVVEIKSRLAELVPEYMIPRKIVVRDSLPMTQSGKVDRKKLLGEL